MSAIWVEITGTRGSAPRDAGTVMQVTAEATWNTIGGGALEFAAIARARAMLAQGIENAEETVPLGPGLGQCCGGSVSLRYSRQKPDVAPTEAATALPAVPHLGALWLWGAGHVGRAVVAAAPRESFDITWVDDAPERFPQDPPQHVTTLPAADMPRLATHADRAAHHLIFTYSHEIDLALCAALLQRGVRSIGLIGSETKKARFFKRLRDMGLDPAPITCPIGDKALGKEPAQIAFGTLAALMEKELEPA